MVESHLVEIGHAQQLTLRLRGIDEGTQEVEDGGKLQSLADGAHELHGTGEELCVEIDDACLVETKVELVEVVSEPNPMLGDDVGGTRSRRGSIVAVLGHFVASPGDDEARGSGDVERVLAVAASAHHIDIAVAVEGHRHACLEDAIAEAQQLVDGDASHLQGREQRSDLLVGILTLGDAHQNVLHLFTCQLLMVQELGQNLFHRSIKFLMIVFPSGVSTLSGWNCMP